MIVLDTAMDSVAHRTLLARIPASRVLAVSASAWTEFSQLPADVALLGVVPTPSPTLGRIADFCLLLEDLQDPGNVGSGGDSLFTADLRGPIAIALGNEGAGLSASLRAAATRRVTIPMPGRFESLNAAAAAAVCLFECVRQRGLTAVSCSR